MPRNLFRAVLALIVSALPAWGLDVKPKDGPLMTRWAKDVKPDSPLPEYPRPQLVRNDWMNLNGVWQLAFGAKDDTPPVGKRLPESIIVPFPVESALSGVMKPADRLWYRRLFKIPEGWKGKRVLLHFGAVDWEAEVFVNGKPLGTHRGGYDGFSFDVTESLTGTEDQELIVRVFDPTDAGTQPRGKQVERPEGIYYTPSTGIWQTVWLEPVAETHIEGLKITATDLETGAVAVVTRWTGPRDGMSLWTTIYDKDREVCSNHTELGLSRSTLLRIPNPVKPWSPDSPFLYGLKVELRRGDTVVDSVTSEFGVRSISLKKDENGVNRLALNCKILFQSGPLDQGFWPDGLMTAPTDEALRYDIEITKKLGYNMTRKHVKVEPDRWYYWCDKLGLLVWQDMPSGDRSISPSDPDIVRTPESARQYEAELQAMIDGRGNHPSIVMWVVFNEGWGQFDTPRIAAWTEKYDPTRLVDSASGWTDRGVGHVYDFHSYPHPSSPPIEARRASVLGEFGGLALAIEGHTWSKSIWGYESVKGKDELTLKYERLLREAWDLKRDKGLSALVYTQLTDVETECNGLLTYDRAIIKVDLARVAAVNRGDFRNVPETRVVVPSSRDAGLTWSYTTEKPADGWYTTRFDTNSWKTGPGVLGTSGTPGASVRTEWKTPDVWARREFDLKSTAGSENFLLAALHDEDAEFYINGVLAASVRGYVGSYQEVFISPEARATLKPGKNLLAVHCHQTSGGQAIDAGIIELVPPKR